MKRIWVSLVAAGLLTIAAIAPAAGQNIFSVAMDEVDESGIIGGGSIRGVDGGVEITVFISQGDGDGVHPVHIHDGTCDELGDVVHPLNDIEDGESVTTLEDVTLADIMTGEYAINAHQSEDEMDTYVMCGNIPAVESLGGDEEEEGDEEGSEDDDGAEEDDAAEEDDDEAAEDEDDDAAEDDDEAAEDEEDDAAEEDDDAAEEEDDDASEDEEDDATEDEEDDAAEDEDEDGEEVVPAAGSTGGIDAESVALMIALMGGATLGTGLLVRRRFAQA